MRPSFKLVVLVASTAVLCGLEGPARPSPQVNLATDCQPFFAAALKPPMAMPMMRMRGMQMLDAASGPLPLVCLTMKDPPKPPLFAGIGTPTIPVSGDATIQSYFDQGLRFYMGFNNRESYRAFRFAAEAAEKARTPCAWCYWGAAVPLGTDINMGNELEPDRLAANNYLAQARALKPTGLLAALIEATAKRSQSCSPNEPPETCRNRRNRGYYDAMSQIRRANPQDPNIGVLFADSILNLTPWRLPEPDKFQEARGTLETLMASNPSHNGLIHWYIHLMELSDDPGRADSRARTLAALAPKAGHLVHMPSHIYYRIGDMGSAMQANLDASAADEAYFGDPDNPLQHPDGDRYRYGYYPHTLHFLAAAATLAGNKIVLEEAAKRLYDTPPPDAQGYRKDKYREVYYLARVNFATTAEIRAFVKPEAPSSVQPRGNAAYAYTQVMADLWDRKTPTDTLSRFEAEVRNYPNMGPKPNDACFRSIVTNGDTGLCTVAIELNLVRGRLAALKQDWDGALAYAQQAADLQRQLPYDEPPDWLYSLTQSGAAILIRKAIAQDPYRDSSQAALRLAKEGLLESLQTGKNRSDVFPGSGWAYFGLWQVARYLKGEDAAAAERAFRAKWAGIEDPTLDRM